jgi:hypothetical protein
MGKIKKAGCLLRQPAVFDIISLPPEEEGRIN